MPPYPNAALWSHTHQIQIATVADGAALVVGSATECVVTYELVDKTIVTNANLQMQLLSDYKRNSKIKSQEYSTFLWDKKSLITILYGQCDEATQTEIALRDNYTNDWNGGRLLVFVDRMRAICFGGDDGGLSFPPNKQVVVVKSLNTYTNNDTYDPNDFKEQVKIKYETTKAIVGRFPNGTAILINLLSNADPALDWNGYCALPADDRLEWERRADALTQGMIYIMNSKNEIDKKDLWLAYSQGNHTTYPANIGSAARYLTT